MGYFHKKTAPKACLLFFSSCLDASSHKTGKFYHTRDCMYSPPLKESSGNCQFSFSVPFLGLKVGHG